jgi:hypothetical protein
VESIVIIIAATMPGREQFLPPSFLGRFLESRALQRARKEFVEWQQSHPIESQILNILEIERRHDSARDIPRRARIADTIRQGRRALGFGDHLVKYVDELPFRLEESLARDGVVLVEEELKLLKEVNHGSWARVGFFTEGVHRLERLG